MTHSFEHTTEQDRQLDLLAETMNYDDAHRYLGIRADDEPEAVPVAMNDTEKNWSTLPSAREILDAPLPPKDRGYRFARDMAAAVGAGDKEWIAELLRDNPETVENTDGKVA